MPAGEAVTFDASHSTSSNGEITAYDWFTSNGDPGATGPTFTRTFSEPGRVGVQVTVEDENGNTDLEAIRVEVTNGGPALALEGPEAVPAGESATVGVDLQGTDLGRAANFEWTVTRGRDSYGETVAQTEGADELEISFTPGQEDTYYTVEGTVTDENGQRGIATHILKTAPQPVARLEGPKQVPTNESVTFDASQSTPGDSSGEIVDYRWHTSNTDEIDESGRTVAHTFTETGRAAVQVTVEDENGYTATEAVRIEVTDDGPVPAFNGPDAVSPGSNANVGIDPSRTNLWGLSTIEWTVTRESDGKTIAQTQGKDELSVSFTPTQKDTYYTVEGVLIDENGRNGIGTHVVKTAPQPEADVELVEPDRLEEISVGDEVTFEEAASHEDDSVRIVDYRWITSNMDTSETGKKFTHTFAETGRVGVQLTVEDENGNTDSTAIRVDVSET